MAVPGTNSNFTSVTTNRVRVLGSGFTVFFWDSQPVAFAQQVSHTSPQPVGPGPVAIQPLDEPYPIQVITPAAAGMGSITLNLYEVYGSKVWDRLGKGPNSLAGMNDIVDIFIKIASIPNEINMVKLIRPPKLAGGPPGGTTYAEIYHGCVITNVVDNEQVEIGSMEALKQITVGYRYMTRSDGAKSLAFTHRDDPLTNTAAFTIPNDQG